MTIDKSAVQDFVYHEAALIDSKQFAEWYELYADDALYWMPLAHDQSEDDVYNSLFFEDKLMLKVRIERLGHPRAFSQAPPSFCQHVLQAPMLVEPIVPGANVKTSTPFIYVESQGDEQIVLAGTAQHELSQVDGELRIFRKRIELLNREAALPSIQLFL